MSKRFRTFLPYLFLMAGFTAAFGFDASAKAYASEVVQDKPEKQSGEKGLELDETALKENIAARVRTGRGAQDEKFADFGANLVTIDRKVPVHIQGMTFFAVKISMMAPPPEEGEDTITLITDPGGTLQITDIRDLASGKSLAQEGLGKLISAEDLPPGFGEEIFTGDGAHSVLIISDPFCPYCRKGWEYFKTNREKLKTLRLSHFPLNRPGETACLAIADAHHRQFKVFEMVDFVYSRLRPVSSPAEIVSQFMEEFPELKQAWGEDASAALKHLETNYLAKLREERKTAQSVGINSTPVFFVDNEFIKGFNLEELNQSMP